MNQRMTRCSPNDRMGLPVRFDIEVWVLRNLFPPFPSLGALAVAGGQWAMPGAVEGHNWKQAEDIRDIYDFRDVLGT